MKNNQLKKIGALVLAIALVSSVTILASEADFGALGASDKESYTIEEMLRYAIEDEYLAHAEYELIINELDGSRPFTNIIKAEERHIEEIEALYEAYGLELPAIDPSDYVVLPGSLQEALEAGVTAEINNIAMYEVFLDQKDLPEDIEAVFEALKRASESHLKAFERGASGERGNGPMGNGNSQMQMNGTKGQGQGVQGQGQGFGGNSQGNVNGMKGAGQRGPNSDNRLYQNANEDCINL